MSGIDIGNSSAKKRAAGSGRFSAKENDSEASIVKAPISVNAGSQEELMSPAPRAELNKVTPLQSEHKRFRYAGISRASPEAGNDEEDAAFKPSTTEDDEDDEDDAYKTSPPEDEEDESADYGATQKIDANVLAGQDLAEGQARQAAVRIEDYCRNSKVSCGRATLTHAHLDFTLSPGKRKNSRNAQAQSQHYCRHQREHPGVFRQPQPDHDDGAHAAGTH
jgi:hypothetical protein